MSTSLYPSYPKIPACERSCGRIAVLQNLGGVTDPPAFCALHCIPQSSCENPVSSGTKGIDILGAGIVTSLGEGRQLNFQAMCSGLSGLKPLQYFDAHGFNAKKAYELSAKDVVLSISADRPHCELQNTYRASRLLCLAIKQAVDESGLTPQQLQATPVIVGTGLRELRSLEQWQCDATSFHPDHLHFGDAVRQSLAVWLPCYTLSNACSASLFALGLAGDMIDLDQAEHVIVAGVDVLTESMFGLLDRVHLKPPQQLQPFEQSRQGVLMGEGAAAVVIGRSKLEGKKPLGKLLGVGMNCDAFHETAPSPEGIAKAMRLAHQRSGITANDIDLILAHGTGTILNDKVEGAAMQEVFQEADSPILVTGLKSMTGHTSGASGLVGLVTALEAMQQAMVPPTIGVNEPIVELDGFDLVRDTAREYQAKICQINAFGFGGVNAVAVVEVAHAA